MPAIANAKTNTPAISIILPVLREGEGLMVALRLLAPLREAGAEIILANGGDEELEDAIPYVDHKLRSAQGRARQMNAGALQAQGRILLFLHSDTQLPDNALNLIGQALEQGRYVWGRFDVTIAGRHPLLPIIARAMNFRSRLTGVATGDQAIFVRSDVFAAIGGFSDIALMEDIALSKKLKRISPPACLAQRVITSGRRWDQKGFWRTIFLMWRLRLAYFFGADPNDLAKAYGYRPYDRR